MIAFNGSPAPTLGVELELQILDSDSLELLNIAPKVIASVGEKFGDRIVKEFIQSMIELRTGVCRDMEQVEIDLRAGLSRLQEILEPMGAMFYSSSLHPFARGSRQNVSEGERYQRIMSDLQIVGRRFIAQGLHVHVGVKDAETAIRVNDRMRERLPLLLALTTSSPFYEGEDTGLSSYRTKLFEALPLAGLPEHLGSWEAFTSRARVLESCGIINSVKDLWWDVRPHPEFGTVEVRVCDIPCTLREVLGIAALVQALIVSIVQGETDPLDDADMLIIKANKWQAARYGLDGAFVDAASGARLPLKAVVKKMIEDVRPASDALGSSRYLSEAESILEAGTGAERQRRIYAETRDFREMIRQVSEGFFS